MTITGKILRIKKPLVEKIGAFVIKNHAGMARGLGFFSCFDAFGAGLYFLFLAFYFNDGLLKVYIIVFICFAV